MLILKRELVIVSTVLLVYRTLQSFVEKGLIHLIPTTDNAIKYALCKDDCEAGHHHDNHVHFVCDECGKTTCLDEVTIPSVKLPKGFHQIMRKWWWTGGFAESVSKITVPDFNFGIIACTLPWIINGNSKNLIIAQ